MKIIYPVLLASGLIVLSSFLSGQTIYTYPLASDLSSIQQGGPDLVRIPNNNGLFGEFTTRVVPASTCGQGGTAGGYFFEDDAGLQFNCPEGFIDQTYSLALNFQLDEFISPPPWVRLLSFTHYDDIGMYIKLTGAPTNGTLEFWPYGLAGETDFFNTTDFYQMIIVRTANGMITVYVNGQEFAEYDDSVTQKFVPGDPDHFIVFFRDDPSVLADEASPGFVSSIIIRNLAWTTEEVQAVWENFCSSLLTIDDPGVPAFSVYPNPNATGVLHIHQHGSLERTYAIYDTRGCVAMEGHLNHEDNPVDVGMLREGIYLLAIKEEGAISTVKFIKR